MNFEERFAGHPYSWDYNTKCMFLFLHEMERLRPGKVLYQRMLIRSAGMNLGPRLRAKYASCSKDCC